MKDLKVKILAEHCVSYNLLKTFFPDPLNQITVYTWDTFKSYTSATDGSHDWVI